MSPTTESQETQAGLDCEYMYKTYKNMVWVIISRKIKNKDTCKDVLHDVFVKYLEHEDGAEPFKHEGAAVRWLKITALTTAVDYLRKNSTYNEHVCVMLDDAKTPELCDDSISGNPHEMLEISERSNILCMFINELKPKHYQVIVLRYGDKELSVNEIADRLQIPTQTVYSRLDKSEKILCEKIDKGGLVNDEG